MRLGGGDPNKDSPVVSISRLRPRAAVWLSWLLAQAPLQGHIPSSPRCTRWRSRAATWVSLMTLSATPRGALHLRISRVQHPHRSAGAHGRCSRDRLRCLVPQRWAEAMKKPSRAGGKPAEARPSKALKLKRHTAPKVAAGRSPAMQQIADWLERLGLVQYAQRFAENDISFSVLSDLTDQDLKEIGVSLGHRRQLLRAIAELNGVEKSAPKSVPSAAAPVVPHEAAERRQVTVMFADLDQRFRSSNQYQAALSSL